MKRFYEFEVIIPDFVFERVSDYPIIDLLNYFDVKFDSKGISYGQNEYLVTAPSMEVALQVRRLLFELKRLFDVSYSSTHWLFGAIREVESDEND